MAVNKVVFGSETLIDLTEDTATADTVAEGYTLHLANGQRATGTAKYAASPTANGPATVSNGLHYAQVDSTSTSTAYTVTIPGIDSYYDGLTVVLKNGVVTSAANFTVNVNGLGALGVYSNMAAATRETTIFNANYTLMLIYDSTRVTGGCWVNYRGYYSDANSIAYQVRGNGGTLPAKDKFVRYRLLFTSADGAHFVPANTSTSTNATSSRAVNQSAIDPFGRIVYYSSTTAIAAGSAPGASYLWSQYQVSLGYSFNLTGAALTLTYPAPVYIKCAPQTNGSAIIDSTTPYVQALPTTADGKIYIFLGIAYNATTIDLYGEHPVYYHDGTGIRKWTGAAASSGLPAVTSSDNGKVLMVVNGAWAAGELPVYNGEIVTPAYNVTITLTNPIEPSYFLSCEIWNIPEYGGPPGDDLLGSISSPDGTTTITVNSGEMIGVSFGSNWGVTYSNSDISVSGGVSFVGRAPGYDYAAFSITGDGTITFDSVNYYDD